MSNINRDYLIILDVKSGEVDSPNIYYFNTDKNTSNLYVQMVIKETSIEATPIDNAINYSIKANILKPNMVGKIVEGNLVNEAKAIYEFKLPADCTDFSGNSKIEFEVYCAVDGVEEIATSFATKFKVHGSVLTEQNKYIEDSSDYPILKELMAEAKELNTQSKELNTDSRKLHEELSGALEAEEQRKANESIRITNENAREAAEATRISNENTRAGSEASRISNENTRQSNEAARESVEQTRQANENTRITNENARREAENARTNAEEVRQTNEANRETAEEIRKANEQARIAEHEAMRTEHEQTMTAVNEVKAENAILMENDKKIADRMTQVEISDKRQYVIMEGLMNSAGDGYLKIEDTGNDTTLYNSVEGFVDVKNITGNTMVNSIKNPDDELTLNADINTSGQSVTLTTAVDNGQVDVLAEGNTMVNVCDQQEAVAITKSYTVETGNHVALQGEYDGKARPVVQGNTLVNLVTNNFSNVSGTFKRQLAYPVSGTFTIVCYNLGNYKIAYSKENGNQWVGNVSIDKYKTVVTLDAGITVKELVAGNTETYGNITYEEFQNLDIVVLEGDYTNKPIPEYFEGMKSSFEDKVVTQEMVDNGDELAENLGKYRVDYKVTGKNLWNGELAEYGSTDWANSGIDMFDDNKNYARTPYNNLIKVKPNTTYVFNKPNWAVLSFFDINKKFISGHANDVEVSFTTPDNCFYLRFRNYNPYTDIDSLEELKTVQLEEGSTATACEPYKEFTKTYYLNSPLLEGDTIEESGGNVYHVHRYGKVVLDGSADEKLKFSHDDPHKIDPTGTYIRYQYLPDNKPYFDTAKINYICDKIKCVPNSSWTDLYEKVEIDNNYISITLLNTKASTIDELRTYLQSNPLTVAYKLASPTYELISQSDTILTDSYVAGHLDFDTAVPVEKVDFTLNARNTLKYLYPSTDYIIQFESDNVGKLDKIKLGTYGNNENSTGFNVSKGLNKFIIRTLSSIDTNNLWLFGIGFNASNIVVTEATDKDFGYFSGMKSVGELEENKIEILSTNKNIINPSLAQSQKRISNTNGAFINNTTVTPSYAIEEYFPVKSNTELKYSATSDGNVVNPTQGTALFFYDKDKVFIASIWADSSKIITPKNACYVRVSYDMNNSWGTSYNTLLTGQLEYGDTTTDYVPHAENKKQILLNEPLRAVGDTKDRFIHIDGKWYVERNCGSYTITGNDTWAGVVAITGNNNLHQRYINSNAFFNMSRETNYLGKIIADGLPTVSTYNTDSSGLCGYPYVSSTYVGQNWLYFNTSKTAEELKTYFTNNPTTVVYKLASPTYEPVEIAPTVNTYTDVTHITNNSTIPMNMPIVNSGYEVIAKPNTKYTVVGMTSGRIGDSTIVNGTITTPATITDNFLRPYGSGKTSKVMLLEGEPTNIPGYFTGIKSVFEDKVTDDGKYACEVRVYNDLGNETKQTLYLDEPLYNTNNITIYNDKLGYWKNWDKVVLDGSGNVDDTTVWGASSNKTIEYRISGMLDNRKGEIKCDKFAVAPVSNLWLADVEGIQPFTKGSIDIRVNKARLGTLTMKQYLSQNPVTVVYQLAEPEFIPLIDNCPNWVISSWDNCSIHFDSIIPLLATRYRYTGNVPSVISLNEEVSTVSDISDEQDSLLVDMATELAVMKLTM